MKGQVLLAAAFASVALAQLPTLLPSDESVAAQVDGAQQRVLMVVPSLWSEPVSEALRRAAQNRGVTVRLVVQARYAEAPDAYTSWHALQGTAHVRTSSVAGEIGVDSYLLIDGAVLVDGPFVSSPTRTFDARDTYAVRDPTLVEARTRAFEALWQGTTPFVSFVDSLEFDLP